MSDNYKWAVEQIIIMVLFVLAVLVGSVWAIL